MGIYDREYYRRDGPSFLGSFTGQGKACKWLIGINVVLFVVQIAVPAVTNSLEVRLSSVSGWSDQAIIQTQTFRDVLRGTLGPDGVKEFDALPPEQQERLAAPLVEAVRQKFQQPGVLQGRVWQLLTYAFLHSTGGGLPWHIIFNMLFLWWFGHEMEEMYGPREFTVFYLVSAVLGGVAYFLWSWARGNLAPCVGASGAVTAVMVLYAFHFPRRIIYLWWVLPIPIWLFVGFQVVQDAFVFTSGMHTTTAVTVHLAGAAFGFGYYKGNWRLAPLLTGLSHLRLPRRKPRLSVYDEEETPTQHRRPRSAAAGAPTGVAAAPPQAAADEHLEAQVDAVLEKVARSGRDSLTEHEKALLVRASEVYKRKQRP